MSDIFTPQTGGESVLEVKKRVLNRVFDKGGGCDDRVKVIPQSTLFKVFNPPLLQEGLPPLLREGLPPLFRRVIDYLVICISLTKQRRISFMKVLNASSLVWAIRRSE